ELELHAVELEHLLVLLDERVLGLDQDADQRFLVEAGDRADHRQAADELGDEAELEQVLGEDVLQHRSLVLLAGSLDLGPEADAAAADPALDDLVQPGEGAAADEQDVGGVDLDELLVGRLASTA